MDRYKLVVDLRDFLMERLDGQPEYIMNEIKNINNRLHFESDFKASYRNIILLLREFTRSRWHFSMKIKYGNIKLNISMVFDYKNKIELVEINY